MFSLKNTQEYLQFAIWQNYLATKNILNKEIQCLSLSFSETDTKTKANMWMVYMEVWFLESQNKGTWSRHNMYERSCKYMWLNWSPQRNMVCLIQESSRSLLVRFNTTELSSRREMVHPLFILQQVSVVPTWLPKSPWGTRSASGDLWAESQRLCIGEALCDYTGAKTIWNYTSSSGWKEIGVSKENWSDAQKAFPFTQKLKS